MFFFVFIFFVNEHLAITARAAKARRKPSLSRNAKNEVSLFLLAPSALIFKSEMGASTRFGWAVKQSVFLRGGAFWTRFVGKPEYLKP